MTITLEYVDGKAVALLADGTKLELKEGVTTAIHFGRESSVKKELRFKQGKVSVLLQYNPEAEHVEITANHAQKNPPQSDYIKVVQMEPNGEYSFESEPHYFAESNYHLCFSGRLLDRYSICISFAGVTVYHGIDITENGLRLNDY